MKTDDIETLQGFIELACVGKNIHVGKPMTIKEFLDMIEKAEGAKANDNPSAPLDDPTL